MLHLCQTHKGWPTRSFAPYSLSEGLTEGLSHNLDMLLDFPPVSMLEIEMAAPLIGLSRYFPDL